MKLHHSYRDHIYRNDWGKKTHIPPSLHSTFEWPHLGSCFLLVPLILFKSLNSLQWHLDRKTWACICPLAFPVSLHLSLRRASLTNKTQITGIWMPQLPANPSLKGARMIVLHQISAHNVVSNANRAWWLADLLTFIVLDLDYVIVIDFEHFGMGWEIGFDWILYTEFEIQHRHSFDSLLNTGKRAYSQ